jgi:hypothetical protein
LPTTSQQDVSTANPFVEQAKLAEPDGRTVDDLGWSVSISGNTVVVGEPAYNGDPGAAYVFTESGSGWTQAAKLTAPDGGGGDFGGGGDLFGRSVSISGNTVVVGAPYAGGEAGLAYVFTESASGWAQAAEFAASDGADSSANFGTAVSVSGNTVVVGAPGADGGAGGAYVFTEPASGWANMTQTAKLTASDGAAGDYFGNSVSISGSTVVVGAPGNAADGSYGGASYVFAEPGWGWTTMNQTAELTASDGTAGGCFGESVSIDSNTVVVGGAGAAYVFTEPTSGWVSVPQMVQTAELTPSAYPSGVGTSVSISGNTVVVGGYNDGGLNGSGGGAAAFVFTEPISGWVATDQAAALTASDGAPLDEFGCAVSISGSTIVVGAYNATIGLISGQGAAYVFGTSPVATSVTSVSTQAAANSGYAVGAMVPITIIFSDSVAVTGAPQLALNDGGLASYASGSGTPWLTFTYLVAAGQNTQDLDYSSTTALTLNGGSVNDPAGNAALLALPATGTDGLASRNIAVGQLTTPSLYDPFTSWWYLRDSNTTGGADIMAGYGPPGGNWTPLVGDWTGSGVDTIGLYNPATGYFYLRNSNTTGVGDITFFYGDPTQNWIPVVGDWTGQKSSAGFPIDSIGLYDPKTCTWYLRNELTTGVADITIGYGPPEAGWEPIVGDWDGNGTTTVGLYNPANGYFYLRNSNTTGVGNISFFYGDPTKNWTPVAGDWTGAGHDSIGMYDPSTGTWYLRNELSTGVADITFGFGSPGAGWLPVVGDWSDTSSSQTSAPAPLAQADWQPIVAVIGNPSSLPATTQTIDVASDQPQLPSVDLQAADQPLGQFADPANLDAPAVSLTVPAGVQKTTTAGAVDAVFAQLS